MRIGHRRPDRDFMQDDAFITGKYQAMPARWRGQGLKRNDLRAGEESARSQCRTAAIGSYVDDRPQFAKLLEHYGMLRASSNPMSQQGVTPLWHAQDMNQLACSRKKKRHYIYSLYLHLGAKAPLNSHLLDTKGDGRGVITPRRARRIKSETAVALRKKVDSERELRLHRAIRAKL